MASQQVEEAKAAELSEIIAARQREFLRCPACGATVFEDVAVEARFRRVEDGDPEREVLRSRLRCLGCGDRLSIEALR